MTDIKTLENILHREEMKKPHAITYDGWYERVDETIEKYIPHGKELKITEYAEKYIKPANELDILRHQEAQLIKAQRSILFGALYIYAMLILLMSIYIWA